MDSFRSTVRSEAPPAEWEISADFDLAFDPENNSSALVDVHQVLTLGFALLARKRFKMRRLSPSDLAAAIGWKK